MRHNPELSAFIGLPYRYNHSPTARPANVEDGVNCQLLVHIVFEILTGVRLPNTLLSKEIYLDSSQLFLDVQPDQTSIGDIFLFGRTKDQDPTHLHLAIATDINRECGPLLIHATRVEQRVTVWSLQQFLSHEKYRVLFGVKHYRFRQ